MSGATEPPSSKGEWLPQEAAGPARPPRPAGGDFLRDAPFPFLVLSLEGIVLEANRAAESFLSVSARSLVGWPMLRFVVPTDRRAYLDLLVRARRMPLCEARVAVNLSSGEVPARIRVSTHEERGRSWLLVAIEDLRALRGAEETVRAFRALLEQRVAQRNQELAATNVALREKIDECGRLELELRYRMQALSDADRAKDEFLAMLAHELRNPLAPIRNAVEVLRRRESSDPAVQWARGIIDRQVEHLRRLVDDLLDVSRITQGKIDLRTGSLDLVEVVERGVELSQPGIAARGHRLDVRLADEPLCVEGDRERLAQALANVLNNAMKYTDPGGRIDVAVRREGTEARLVVRDTGQGIPQALLPKIFDAFVQGERGLDRSQGGLGIGLTLVKKVVEMHGGRVEARSPGPGLGAEIEIALPLAAMPAARHASDGSIEPAVPSSKRVLVVDDNADAAESLLRLLELEGHHVLVAFDGPTALRVAAEFRPDVLLLDIGLPGMNGCELASAFRARPDTHRALIVAVSGYGGEDAVRRSAAAGFDRHLVKPVDPGALAEVIAQAPALAA